MKKILLLSTALFALVACNKNKANDEAQEKKLIDEVMAVHDEVMPKGDELMSLKSKLDSVAKVSSDSLKIKDLVAGLDSADNQMSDWMEAYDPDIVKGKSHEEIVKYFEEEKGKITQVKNLTNSSIEKAQKFLNK